MTTPPYTVVDTCCLINLCAIDRPLENLFQEIPTRLFLCPAVEREAISIRPHADAKSDERQHVDLAACVAAGVLGRCGLEGELERQLYVRLAATVDDGEAMSLAIASHRGWAIATDDRPARRAAAQLGLSVLGTPELVRAWAEAASVSAEELRATVLRIESLARYLPAPDLSCHAWWARLRGEGV